MFHKILDHDDKVSCIYITGKVMSYISVNMVMIQSRTKTIDDTSLATAQSYFSKCNLGSGVWKPITQSAPTCT